MTTLRLILGDQLNRLHPWFAKPDAEVVYLMLESRQETDYVLHHAQKVIAIFAAMRAFAAELERCGHRVHYLRIGAADNAPSLNANLTRLMAHYQAHRFEWQAPDEFRLDQSLRHFAQGLKVPTEMVDTAHFYTQRDQAAQMFAGQKSWMMERFYRAMRRQHQVLLEANGQPLGEQWNWDAENRRSWPGHPAEPKDWRVSHDHTALWHEIQSAGVQTFGVAHAAEMRWPLNREEALADLERFIDTALPHFGTYQDAMHSQARRLFHSLLSFALNTKMLNPREVVDRAQKALAEGAAPLPAVEGFVRQILGWREYMRGVYWARMPALTAENFFLAQAPLPRWFWNGETQMACLRQSIGDSLEYAYAHHIQRLMVIGNFALLAGIAPSAVHRWYLGIYIDAIEWVEAPNTLGMSQFADGGKLASKPYAASAAYIHRMSDYCKGCAYDRRLRVGESACPFNALYWDFFARHRAQLGKHPRLAVVYKNLERLPPSEQLAIREQANAVRQRIEIL